MLKDMIEEHQGYLMQHSTWNKMPKVDSIEIEHVFHLLDPLTASLRSSQIVLARSSKNHFP